LSEHDATPVVAVAARVQLVAENEPEPLEEKPTLPVGVLTVPAFVSVTVLV
jgi:hypothetical protein